MSTYDTGLRRLALRLRSRDRNVWEPAAAELAVLARAGSAYAENEIIGRHEEHVREECRRVRVPHSALDDFAQEGLLALRGPIRRFDPSRGVPLWGYARPSVRGRIIDVLGKSAGLTPHQSKLYRRVRHAYDVLIADPARAGREPELSEVVAAFRALYGFGLWTATAGAVLEARRGRYSNPLPRHL